jgi:hypothetical protein
LSDSHGAELASIDVLAFGVLETETLDDRYKQLLNTNRDSAADVGKSRLIQRTLENASSSLVISPFSNHVDEMAERLSAILLHTKTGH